MTWIYSLPFWLFGIITVVVFCAFGVSGLALTRRWVPALHGDFLYNDIVGHCMGAITVLNGITLSLLLVGNWTTLTEIQQRVDREAGTLAVLYLDVSKFPEPYRTRLQGDLKRYTREVLEVAWPQQQRGILPRGSLPMVFDILDDLAAYEPASEEQKILHFEALRTFNEFEERRASRLFGVTASLSGTLWALVLIGAVVNIAATWFFHLHNQRMHVWLTALTSSLLGLMIFFLAAMDHPYLGKISVNPEPYRIVYDRLMKPGAVAPGTLTPPTP